MAPKRAIRERPFNFIRRLKEISMFFAGKDEVHKTLRRIVKRLEKAGISYAVMGGMAVNAHKYQRTTGDVDLLLTQEGLEEFQKRYVSKNYVRKEGHTRRFIDRVNNIQVDCLVTGRFPGSGAPGPFAFPDPVDVAEEIGKVRVVNLVMLVQFKLAARRHRDFGDVVELIRFNNLDESFAPHLHPSVRQDYIECLEEKRRNDEYEAREG
ncbi:MAG TPA: hypothetical protein VH643_27045 [Gemmataceae bacterium]|jgi:hypothetical protein